MKLAFMLQLDYFINHRDSEPLCVHVSIQIVYPQCMCEPSSMYQLYYCHYITFDKLCLL